MSNLWLALVLLGVGVWVAHDGLAPRPAIREARRSWAPVDRVRDWLAQADLPGVTIWHVVVLCTAGCVAGGFAGYVTFGVPVTATHLKMASVGRTRMQCTPRRSNGVTSSTHAISRVGSLSN